MLHFCLLGSGSSGNAALVFSGKSKILLDCGFSYVQLQARAEQAGVSLENIQGVFITHEHGDHVAGLGVFCRRTGVTAYMTPDTFTNLPAAVGKIPNVELMEAGSVVTLGDLDVMSYSVSHDAADPVSYIIQSQGTKLGFATDLGHCSHLVRARLAGCHALILESNYCPELLRKGGYPPQVQQRIRGRSGHLSNHDMTELLAGLLHDTLHLVILVHISENNNSPDLVHRMAKTTVGEHPLELVLAAQDIPTRLFEVAP